MGKSLSYFADKFSEELKADLTEQTALSICNKILNLKHEDGTYLSNNEMEQILSGMENNICKPVKITEPIHLPNKRYIVHDSNNISSLKLLSLMKKTINDSNSKFTIKNKRRKRK